MTCQQLNARPVALTEQEIEQVTGGQNSNVFEDSMGNVVKVTGSFDATTPPFPTNGTLNVHIHGFSI